MGALLPIADFDVRYATVLSSFANLNPAKRSDML